MNIFDIWNKKAFYSLFHGKRNHKIHLMNAMLKLNASKKYNGKHENNSILTTNIFP